MRWLTIREQSLRATWFLLVDDSTGKVAHSWFVTDTITGDADPDDVTIKSALLAQSNIDAAEVAS